MLVSYIDIIVLERDSEDALILRLAVTAVRGLNYMSVIGGRRAGAYPSYIVLG